MKFLLDTADISEVREFSKMGLVDGVTTNPSLIAKTARPFQEVIGGICDLIKRPVSAEVTATKAEAMVAEGQLLAKIARNVVVKVPST